jgi:hypothetical protein
MAKHDDELMKIIQARIKKNALQERESIMRSILGDNDSPKKSAKANQTVQEEMFSSLNDPFDYHVQIGKRDQRNDKGEVIGWDKTVHRYKAKKDENPYQELARGLKKKATK